MILSGMTIADVKRELNNIPKNIRQLMFGSYGIESIFEKLSQKDIEDRIQRWENFKLEFEEGVPKEEEQ